jgi:hypothetical protein
MVARAMLHPPSAPGSVTRPMVSDFDRLARELQRAAYDQCQTAETWVVTTNKGRSLAAAALAFWKTPSAAMLQSARAVLSTATEDDVRRLLAAVADAIVRGARR